MDGIIEQKSKRRGKPSRFIYTPDAQNVKPAVIVVGYLMRAMIVCLGTAALSIFFCSAYLLTGLSSWGIFFVSLAFSAVFAFMAVNRKFFFIGGGALLLGLAVPLLITGDPVRYLLSSLGAFSDGVMNTLSSNGYQAPLWFGLAPVGGRTAEQMQVGGIVVFTLLIAAVMTVSVIRRVHIVPMLLIGVPICVAVFTYNFSDSNWGFALLIVVLCSVLVLRHYDVCFKDKKVSFRSAALGGYSGFTAALLALLVVLIPASSIHSRWKPIGGISEKMEVARAVMSSVLIGEKPDWSNVESHGQASSLGTRATAASPRYYTNEEELEVYSDYRLPIYIKGFVAAAYNKETNVWRCANRKELEAFDELLGEEFDPELYSRRFYSFASPNGAGLSATKKYDENLSLGFVTTRVSLNVLKNGSNMLFTPSRYDPLTGFLDYPGDRDSVTAFAPYDEKVMTYFDGIRTTEWTNFNKRYQTLTYLPVYRDAKYAVSMQEKIRAYTENRNRIETFYKQSMALGGSYTLEQYMADTGDRLNDGVIDYSMFRSFTSMSFKEQKAYYDVYFTGDGKYRDYVHTQYTPRLGTTTMTKEASALLFSRILDQPVEEVFIQTDLEARAAVLRGDPTTPNISLSERYYKMGDEVYTVSGLLYYVKQRCTEDFAFQHKVVLDVISYLGDTCTYTLTPASSAKLNSLTPIEKFLTETKEGYCVQFASAACFLLREFGIPVRYVEGFLADGLTLDKSDGHFAMYHTTVLDRDQHAWIEVWNDSTGWLTYETVPTKTDEMYKVYEEVIVRPPEYDPSLYEDPTDDPTEDEPWETGDEPGEPGEDEEEIDPKEIWKGIGIVAGIAAVIAAAVVLIRREKNRRLDLQEHRFAVLEAVRKSELNAGERMEYGRQLSALVTDAMQAGGLVRGKREFPTEFASRVDTSLASLDMPPALSCPVSEAVPIMEQIAFGTGIPKESLVRLADFYESLCEETAQRFNGLERWWYCRVRCVI